MPRNQCPPKPAGTCNVGGQSCHGTGWIDYMTETEKVKGEFHDPDNRLPADPVTGLKTRTLKARCPTHPYP